MQLNRFPVHTNSDNNFDTKARYITYTEWGDPDNPHIVVCVHGLTHNCRDFDFLAKALETNCRVICVDVVGRGQSDWLTNIEDYDHHPLYLSDAVALLAHVGALENNTVQLDWVGISMGGLIGMMMAIQPESPCLIRRLVMSDIGPLIPAIALAKIFDHVSKDPRFNSFNEFKAHIKETSSSYGHLTDAQWHHLAVHSARKFDNGTYGYTFDPGIAVSLKNHISHDINMWTQWDALNIPTLILHGVKSDVLHPDTVEKMQVRGAMAQIIELPNIGHAPMLMSDDQIILVKDYLLAP
ncbi:MAG: alpha/beta hydrolase [Nitrosomonadaceae bacterium]